MFWSHKARTAGETANLKLTFHLDHSAGADHHFAKSNAAPVGWPWMWNLFYGFHKGRTPTQGYD
jgi:hypothetical protein